MGQEKKVSEAIQKYSIIDNDKALVELTADLKRKKAIAVDLEADSMYHFKEKICLIQISTGTRHSVVDPFQIDDMSPLKEILESKSVQKIFHGADYDIRSLNRDYGVELKNLFDTQVAGRFLGLRETSLEHLLRNRMNVVLDKRYQKSNWSVRPLPKEMMDYAASDVIYLVQLAGQLKSELREKGRSSWVREECGFLCNVRPATDNGEPLFTRIKGAGMLRPKNLAVLEALLRLRLDFAEKKDRPPFKVIGNQSLLKIAGTIPTDYKALEKIHAVSNKQLHMYGREIVETVKTAANTPPSDLPSYPRKKSRSLHPLAADRISKLKQWRDEEAQKLEVDPSIILTKSIINAIAAKNPKSVNALKTVEDIKNWRIKAFGKSIVQCLTSKNSSSGN